jgi:hypothetical protein
LRGIIASSAVVIIALLSFAVPWYPVVNQRYVTQTFTDAYTNTYQVPTQSSQGQTIFTLSSPIELQGMLQQGTTYSDVLETLGSVRLQMGTIILVQVIQCTFCYVNIKQEFGNDADVFLVSGSTTGSFMAMNVGGYNITVGNTGSTEGQISFMDLIADAPQNRMQTTLDSNTQYNTVTLTQYSVNASSLYTVLGIFPTVTILTVVGLVVVLAVIMELDLIKVRRRRRR